MRTYVFKLNELGTLEEFKLDEKNYRVFISNDRQSITRTIANFINKNSEVHIHPFDLCIVNRKNNETFNIINYRDIFNDRRYINLRDIVKRSLKKNDVYYHDYNANMGNDSKKKHSIKNTLKRVGAGLAASLIISGAVSGVKSLFKKNIDKEIEIKPKPTTIEAHVSNYSFNTVMYETKIASPVLTADAVSIQNDSYVDDEEYVEHPEDFIEFVRPSLEEEITTLMEYFNVSSAEQVLNFVRVFINTMKEYDKILTEEEMIDIFYDMSQVPQDVKINEIKDTYGLTDEQVDEYAATHIGEGGTSYIDPFASSTTALNHSQYQVWINSLTKSRGMDVQDNIYLHTCYIPQFEAYKGRLYTQSLGDRSIIGYTAALDAIYLCKHYNIVMHNYAEFRSNGTTSFSNIQFTKNGNRFGHKMNPEDRLVDLTNENDKTLKLS